MVYLETSSKRIEPSLKLAAVSSIVLSTSAHPRRGGPRGLASVTSSRRVEVLDDRLRVALQERAEGESVRLDNIVEVILGHGPTSSSGGCTVSRSAARLSALNLPARPGCNVGTLTDRGGPDRVVVDQ